MGELERVWIVVFNDWLDEGWGDLRPGEVLGVFTRQGLAEEFKARYIEANPGVEGGFKELEIIVRRVDILEVER
jgi:hypothetical protein